MPEMVRFENPVVAPLTSCPGLVEQSVVMQHEEVVMIQRVAVLGLREDEIGIGENIVDRDEVAQGHHAIRVARRAVVELLADADQGSQRRTRFRGLRSQTRKCITVREHIRRQDP